MEDNEKLTIQEAKGMLECLNKFLENFNNKSSDYSEEWKVLHRIKYDRIYGRVIALQQEAQLLIILLEHN